VSRLCALFWDRRRCQEEEQLWQERGKDGKEERGEEMEADVDKAVLVFGGCVAVKACVLAGAEGGAG
jgi:hypothetical protein